MKVFLGLALFIFLPLSIASSSFAADCNEADLRPSFANIPALDQGSTNLCFAYSAAQLIDHNQAGHTIPTTLAAATVAAFSTGEKQSNAFGGWIEQSLEIARRQGVKIPDTKQLLRTHELGGNPLKEGLNELLSKEIPVAVNFCAEVVLERGFALGLAQDCARHYAVAIAQKNENGSCQVLLRDSQCGAYERKAGKRICKQGEFWIGRSQLIQSALGLTWL
jgi:hypothetical protein